MESKISMDEQFMGKIHLIIINNIDNEIFGVEQLAEEAGLSRSMLHRKLIKIKGKSASDIITDVRLSTAKQLLEKDIATASEVAYRVGFKSPSYFTKVFKKHFGISPGEVRKGGIVSSLSKTHSTNNINKSKFQKYKVHFLVAFIAVFISISGLFIYFQQNNTTEAVAVLPLHNLTGNKDLNYLVDGLHESIVGELGRISTLRTISRTSTLQFKENNLSMRNIAKELGVDYLVEGSLLQAGDSLRIILQLIDVFPKEQHLMSKEYSYDMANVLNFQSHAVQDIAAMVNVSLSKDEKRRLQAERKINIETYQNYLRGMYYLNQGTAESNKKGIEYLESAIKKNPVDAFAYAGLAIGYSTLGHGQVGGENGFIAAEAAAKKAIKLDPTIDEPYISLSMLYLYKSWDWPKAKSAFEGALKNNPNNEIAHAHFAWYHMLYDDMENSIYHARQAALIEPLSATYSAWLAYLYCYNNDFQKAEKWANQAFKLSPENPYSNVAMGWICLSRNEFSAAIEYHSKLPTSDPRWALWLCYTYTMAQEKEKALELWNEFEQLSSENQINPCYMGLMASILGYTDIAFEYLNKAVETKAYPVPYINFYPFTLSIRNHDRYNDLLRKLNLPTQNI